MSKEKIGQTQLLVVYQGLARLGFASVTSVDKERRCIELMEARHEADPSLHWQCVDILQIADECKGAPLCGGGFDVVADKGGLDAFLVEDVGAHALLEAHRALKPGGVYLIVSMHPERLLSRLLQNPSIGFEWTIKHHFVPMHGNPAVKVSLVLARKSQEAKDSPSLPDVQSHTREVMNWWFREEKPLVNPQTVKEIARAFARPLPVEEAHLVLTKIIFGGDLDFAGADFTLQDFLDDLGAMNPNGPAAREVSELDAIAYLLNNQ